MNFFSTLMFTIWIILMAILVLVNTYIVLRHYRTNSKHLLARQVAILIAVAGISVIFSAIIGKHSLGGLICDIIGLTFFVMIAALLLYLQDKRDERYRKSIMSEKSVKEESD
jgi:uncharacterized membrane protein YesL